MYRNCWGPICEAQLGPELARAFGAFILAAKSRINTDAMMYGQMPLITKSLSLVNVNGKQRIVVEFRSSDLFFGGPLVLALPLVFALPLVDSAIDYIGVVYFKWEEAFVAGMLAVLGLIPSPNEAQRCGLTEWFTYSAVLYPSDAVYSSETTLLAMIEESLVENDPIERRVELECV